MGARRADQGILAFLSLPRCARRYDHCVEESVLTERAGNPVTDSRSALAVQDIGIGDEPDASGVPVTSSAVTPITAPSAPEVPGRVGGRRLASLPYVLALAGLAGGLVWMWFAPKHVEPGTVAVAGALLVAALERLVLPERWAGMLLARRRVPDVMALAALGAGILAVALVLPATS